MRCKHLVVLEGERSNCKFSSSSRCLLFVLVRSVQSGA
jgi:hypothetical protein